VLVRFSPSVTLLSCSKVLAVVKWLGNACLKVVDAGLLFAMKRVRRIGRRIGFVRRKGRRQRWMVGKRLGARKRHQLLRVFTCALLYLIFYLHSVFVYSAMEERTCLVLLSTTRTSAMTHNTITHTGRHTQGDTRGKQNCVHGKRKHATTPPPTPPLHCPTSYTPTFHLLAHSLRRKSICVSWA